MENKTFMVTFAGNGVFEGILISADTPEQAAGSATERTFLRGKDIYSVEDITGYINNDDTATETTPETADDLKLFNVILIEDDSIRLTKVLSGDIRISIRKILLENSTHLIISKNFPEMKININAIPVDDSKAFTEVNIER